MAVYSEVVPGIIVSTTKIILVKTLELRRAMTEASIP
jgi:hypothetical protein